MSSRPKQSMSELKLRRLLEHNQRLREDLGRPRIRVSEASASLIRYCKTTTDHLVSPSFRATSFPPLSSSRFPFLSRLSLLLSWSALLRFFSANVPVADAVCSILCRSHLCGVLWGETRTHMRLSPAVGVVTCNSKFMFFRICLPSSRPISPQMGSDERNQTHIHSHSGLPPHT